MFGPTVKSDVAVSARINGTKKGRRFPTFGVGLNGQSGYKLQVSPAKGALEIYKGDDMVGTTPFEWKSGEWTLLRLQLVKSGDVWKIEGKAWTQGAPEPAQAMGLHSTEKTEPSGLLAPRRRAAPFPPRRFSLMISPFAALRRANKKPATIALASPAPATRRVFASTGFEQFAAGA